MCDILESHNNKGDKMTTTTTQPKLIATALVDHTRINIWHTGDVFEVDFVHQLRHASDRRSITWSVESSEADARAAANKCWIRFSGKETMIAA